MVGQVPVAAQQPYQQPFQQPPGQYAPPPPGQQPYQPVPGQPQPPKSGGSTLLTVIIILVVVVVAVVAVGATLLFLAVDEITEPAVEKVTVNLASPQVSQRDIEGTVYWDATLNVNKIHPKDSTVDWEDVRIVIKSATGSVLLLLTEPIADNPSMYDDDADGSVDVQVWYNESGGVADGKMGAGENVKLTGLTDEYEGATIEWTRNRIQIASITLPTNFP
jgi:hypothetical protein